MLLLLPLPLLQQQLLVVQLNLCCRLCDGTSKVCVAHLTQISLNLFILFVAVWFPVVLSLTLTLTLTLTLVLARLRRSKSCVTFHVHACHLL